MPCREAILNFFSKFFTITQKYIKFGSDFTGCHLKTSKLPYYGPNLVLQDSSNSMVGFGATFFALYENSRPVVP